MENGQHQLGPSFLFQFYPPQPTNLHGPASKEKCRCASINPKIAEQSKITKILGLLSKHAGESIRSWHVSSDAEAPSTIIKTSSFFSRHSHSPSLFKIFFFKKKNFFFFSLFWDFGARSIDLGLRSAELKEKSA